MVCCVDATICRRGLNSNLARRPESAINNDLENDQENPHVNPKVFNSGNSAEFDPNSATANSSAEINRLSNELNSRISRDMDKMRNSVSVQIQRAINDAISNQVLPQNRNAFKAGSGQVTKNGWDIPSERPEVNSEELRNGKTRKDMGNEQAHGRQFIDHYDDSDACNIFIGDKSLLVSLYTSPSLLSILCYTSAIFQLNCKCCLFFF